MAGGVDGEDPTASRSTLCSRSVPSHDLRHGTDGKPQAALGEETYLITAVTTLTAKNMGLSELPTYNRGSSTCGTH